MKIHVLNAGMKNRTAHTIAKNLQDEHEFVFATDPGALAYENSLTVMETVKGLDRVRIFNDFRNMDSRKLHSIESKRLMKAAIEMEKRVKIIGIPLKGNLARITSDVQDSLQELQDSSYQQLDRL